MTSANGAAAVFTAGRGGLCGNEVSGRIGLRRIFFCGGATWRFVKRDSLPNIVKLQITGVTSSK